MKLPLKKIPNSPYWITNFRINGKKICRSTKETNKKIAYAQAELIWSQEKANIIRPKTIGSITLNQAIDEWLSRLSKKGNPRNRTDKMHLEEFRRKLGNVSIGKITREDLLKLRDTYKGKAKGQSVNRRFVPLMAVFNMAVDEGWIDFAPRYKKLPLDNEKIKHPYTTEEITALINGCRSTNNNFLINPIYFSLATGFRANEVRQLKKEDVIDNNTRVILKSQKNGTKNQIVVLNSTARLVLKEALLNPSDYVFYSPHTDNGCLGDFKNSWIAVRKDADLLHKDFHTLRHTAITRVAKKVANEFELKDYSRHKSIQSLERYIHLFSNSDEIAEYGAFELQTGATTGATH